MDRVLVTGGAKIGHAGVATIVYQWGQRFDGSKLVYDYLMQSGLPEEAYRGNIKKKGGYMYTLPQEKRTCRHVIKWIMDIVRSERYKTIHINTDTAYIAAAYIYAAKKGGIKRIAVHSHSSYIDENNAAKRIVKMLLHKACIPYVLCNADIRLACSSEAAEWMFGKNKECLFIPNGISPKDYRFDENARKRVRESLSMGECLSLCNIGRLSFPKNHSFLIEVFEKYLEINKKCRLYLIGSGELEDELKRTVLKKQLMDSIIFLGQRFDVPQLLSAMDIMIMPSRFEGLPVTLVEAQMADLPCIVSSAVTKEADFTGLVKYVDSWKTEDWAAAISDAAANVAVTGRGEDPEEKENSAFNIETAVKQLADSLLKGV